LTGIDLLLELLGQLRSKRR